jgi:hypothetical protein
MTDGCAEPHEKYLFYEKFVIVIRQVYLLLTVRILPITQQALVDQGLLIIDALQYSEVDTPHSVGLIWTSNQPNAEITT